MLNLVSIAALFAAAALGASAAPATTLANVNPECGNLVGANVGDVKEIYNHLQGLGDQPCTVPAHSFQEFWRSGSAIVGGRNTLDTDVTASW